MTSGARWSRGSVECEVDIVLMLIRFILNHPVSYSSFQSLLTSKSGGLPECLITLEIQSSLLVVSEAGLL